MRPAPEITPKLGAALVEQARIEAAPVAVAVLLAGLIGIGWMVRSTWAQESDKPATPTETPLPLPQEPQLIGTPVPNLSEFPSLPGEPSQPLPTATPPPPTELVPATPPAIAGENEDPEKTVQAFVAQNRRVAEGQLKGLKSEAERLRARLQKVEAGIRRWESLVAALDQSEAAGTDRDTPSNLEALPAARRQFQPTRPSPTPEPGPK